MSMNTRKRKTMFAFILALGFAGSALPAMAAAPAACPAGKTALSLPDGQTLCLDLPAAAATLAVSDFGPITLNPGEYARLAVKNAKPDAADAAPPTCKATLGLALPGLPPRSAGYTLRPGDTRLLDNYVDAAPLAMGARPLAGRYLDAAAAVDSSPAGDRRCAKAVTARVEILDYQTGRLLRSVDRAAQRP